MPIDVSRLEKTNIQGYYKDPRTGVVINTNESELKAYRAARKQTQDFQSLQNEHSQMKNELEKIKKALGI
jgi:hypothetical protein